MSQSLRERIEGLRRFSPASSGRMADKDDGRWIVRSDVLRILAKHERALAAVAMGVQPVAQPSAKVGELPAWLRELERLHSLDAMSVAAGDGARFKALSDLAALRCGVLSGQGDVVITEGVAGFLTCVNDDSELPSPAGTYGFNGRTWVYHGDWERAPGGVEESSERILAAIDSYANSLINP